MEFNRDDRRVSSTSSFSTPAPVEERLPSTQFDKMVPRTSSSALPIATIDRLPCPKFDKRVPFTSSSSNNKIPTVDEEIEVATNYPSLTSYPSLTLYPGV